MAQPVDGRRGLIDVHDPARRAEVHVEAPPAPAEQRVPKLGLPLDERAGPFGPVAGEIGLRVARDAFGESLLVGSDPVDCRIGEAGQRHCAGVDLVLDPIPFGRNGFGERLRRHGQRVSRGRAQRLAVQLHAPAAIALDGLAPASRSASPAFAVLLLPQLPEQLGREDRVDDADDHDDRSDGRPAAFPQQDRCR